ncbi:MAG: IS200/IS605 family transposase [Chitinophagaceae bacterium]|nr:IS200/IS605 family transposase [Chitinophagaceae bacterium]
MPGITHTNIYIHTIWSTNGRQQLLSPVVRKVLFPYMRQHATSKGIQLLAVNGYNDHIHCLFKLMPVQNVQEIVKQLKMDTEDWVNGNRFWQEAFSWEDGYSAYSVSPANVDKSADYINRQEEYHQTKSLEEELAAFEKMVVNLKE